MYKTIVIMTMIKAVIEHAVIMIDVVSKDFIDELEFGEVFYSVY